MLSLITSLLPSIFSSIDNVVDNKTEREKIKQQVQLVLLQNQNEIQKAASDIVLAEAKGNAYVSGWRPTAMYVIIAIIAFNYLFSPIAMMMGFNITTIPLPDELFTLMTIGLGGYIGARTGEKMIKEWKKKE